MSEPFNPFSAPQAIEHVQSLPGSNIEGLAGVERGLKLVYFGICGLFLSAMLGGLFSVAFPQGLVLAGVAIFICWLMLMIGPFLCLSAPEETGAKGLIGASLLCQIIGFLLSVLGNLGLGLPPVMLGVAQLLALIGSVLFVLFLMKIAKHIGRDDLWRKGRNVLVGSVLMMILAVASIAVLFSGNQTLGGLVFLCVGLAGLVLFLMYANLINYLSKAIASLRAGIVAGQQNSNYVG